MRLTRRHILVAAAAVPAAILADRVLQAAADAAVGALGAMRPPAQGTSATRCALCGSSDHTMLDPRCPAARKVS